jgi:cytochrome d ubiquinol oxidase subunit II
MEAAWFAIISGMLATYAVLDGFDLGIGVLYPFLARNEDEKRLLRASIGPVWDGNEVWLITGGGAVFAAFPAVYAMTFSGFYLAIMLVLFGLILRAVSLEFRHRDDAWSTLWDACFFVGSLVPALLFGVAVGNIVRGVPINADGDYAGTFFALLNPYSLLIGVVGLVAFLTHGASWIAVKTEGALHDRAVRLRSLLHWAFVVLLVVGTVATRFAARQHLDHNAGRVVGWLFIVVVVAGIALARWAMTRRDGRGDVFALLGSAAGLAGLVGLAGTGSFPNLVNARGSAAQTALSIHNSASGHLTLEVMLIVAIIFVPIVLGYTFFMYRQFAGKVKAEAGEY